MRTLSALVVVLACVGCGGGGVPGGGDDDGIGGTIELTQVTAFWLPINSERLGASGRVPGADVCLGLIWDFSNLGMARTQHCDDFVDSFPYAVVRAAAGVVCGEVWDYGPDADVISASGCITPDFQIGTAHSLDVTAEVTSPLFSGVVHLATP